MIITPTCFSSEAERMVVFLLSPAEFMAAIEAKFAKLFQRQITTQSEDYWLLSWKEKKRRSMIQTLAEKRGRKQFLSLQQQGSLPCISQWEWTAMGQGLLILGHLKSRNIESWVCHRHNDYMATCLLGVKVGNITDYVARLVQSLAMQSTVVDGVCWYQLHWKM